MKFDVVIYDSIGLPYNGHTRSGIGGSEFAVQRLALALVKVNYKVLVLNNVESLNVQVFDGVVYGSCYCMNNIETTALLLQRCSVFPTNIDFENLVIQVHDMPGGNEHLDRFFRRSSLKATLVAISSWQRATYPMHWNSEIIPALIPDEAYNTQYCKVPGKFIYASAAMKGLKETIARWKELRFSDSKLYVLSSGYDDPGEFDDCSIIKLGTLSNTELWYHIGTSEGMFYVNTYPETFCVTAHLAEVFKTRTHILCLNGRGALDETINSELVTDSFDLFKYRFLEAYGTNKFQSIANNYSISSLLPKWIKVLGL